MSEPQNRSPTLSAGGDLEALLRRIDREEAEAVMRSAERDRPGPAPRFSTVAGYARREGIGESTLRRWVTAAGLRRQTNGRYLTAELDAVAASGGRPAAAAPPLDMAAERARRTAHEILGRPK